jgi:VanZ family protein
VNTSRKLPWLFAVIGWIGVIFFSSTSLAAEWCEGGFSYVSTLLFSNVRPDTSSYSWLHLLADKGLHVTLFVVLALLLWKAIPAVRGKAAAVLFVGLVVGSCSEFLQRFFPGRDPAIRDVLINLAGTAIGVLVSRKLLEFRYDPAEDRSNEKPWATSTR